MVLKLSKFLWPIIQKVLVSVPLRGYGFEIMKKLMNEEIVAAFPSPYGDMVLKFLCSHGWEPVVLFPSPYGDMVLKLSQT